MDGILAPTVNQRLTYGSWLHVYAKSRCQVPERMAELTDHYIVSMIMRVLLHGCELIVWQETLRRLEVQEPWIRSQAPPI